MNIWNTLRRINTGSFWRILNLSIKHPLFLYPTLLATKECMRISTLHFDREHYRNTPANAFRHAFWNYLIAHSCAKWSTNPCKVLKWTKAITDWHENAFINRELPRLMDFHNNEIGRTLYIQNSAKNLDFVVELLLNKTKDAIQIKSPEAISSVSDNLVFLYPSVKAISS